MLSRRVRVITDPILLIDLRCGSIPAKPVVRRTEIALT